MNQFDQNQQLAAKFHLIRDHFNHADPNDFDAQILPHFVSCDAAAQSIIYSFDMKPCFGNPHGVGHGGILVAMIDCAQGATIDCLSEGHPHTVTVSLQTSYLAPVELGRPLFVKVTVQKLGGHIAYCTSEAWQDEGKIAVTTTGVYHHVASGNQ